MSCIEINSGDDNFHDDDDDEVFEKQFKNILKQKLIKQKQKTLHTSNNFIYKVIIQKKILKHPWRRENF